MNIKDTKDFVETLIECGGRDCQHETLEDHYIILKEDIIQDRTKLIEEVIEMAEGMKKDDCICINGSCIAHGYNYAIDDLLSSLDKEINNKE